MLGYLVRGRDSCDYPGEEGSRGSHVFTGISVRIEYHSVAIN